MHNSVPSSLELSLAEFKDEQTWPQLQLVVYKIILGLRFFWVLKVKNWTHFYEIFKVLKVGQKKVGLPFLYSSTEKDQMVFVNYRKITFKIRIAALFIFKTKKNQRARIFYTHQVGAEAKLLHP